MAHIDDLENMTTSELRQRFEEVFGEVTSSKDRQGLIRRITARLAEQAPAPEVAPEDEVQATVNAPAAPEPAPVPPTPGRGRWSRHERDPRLPPVGTPITRNWRGHQIVVIEDAEGTFTAHVDGSLAATGRSLSRVAQQLARSEGLTGAVNGFAFFKMTGPAAPRPRKALTPEDHAAKVARLREAHERAVERERVARERLEAAEAALIRVQADAEPNGQPAR